MIELKNETASAFPDRPPVKSDAECQLLAFATNSRGDITHTNQAFINCIGFERSNLIGAQNQMIRHPDMPRAALNEYWSRVSQNETTAGYLKSRDANGDGLWVFALTTPIQDGFISIRFHPRSEVFETIKEIFSEIQEMEASGATPEKSWSILLSKVKALGFDDYEDFKRKTLTEEYCAWCRAAGLTPSPVLEKIDTIAALIGDVSELLHDIGDGFKNVRGEPVNMRILSGRLEGAGAAIGTISQNYDSMAAEMQQMILSIQSKETGALARMHRSIEQGRFTTLQGYALEQTCQQAGASNEKDEEFSELASNVLKGLSKRRVQEGMQAIAETAAIGQEIDTLCRQLRRRIKGLDVVKLLCRVENGRLGQSDSGLQGIIERLERFHDTSDKYLAELASKAVQIMSISSSLR